MQNQQADWCDGKDSESWVGQVQVSCRGGGGKGQVLLHIRHCLPPLLLTRTTPPLPDKSFKDK